jgi:hypothetical protein
LCDRLSEILAAREALGRVLPGRKLHSPVLCGAFGALMLSALIDLPNRALRAAMNSRRAAVAPQRATETPRSQQELPREPLGTR